MEEAEKRRERLRAMKMEASSSSVPDSDAHTHSPLSNPFSSSPSHLSNPFPSTPSPSPLPFTRFDFYTDPLANFSSATNKRRPPPRGHLNSPQSFAAPTPSQTHGVPEGSPFGGQLRSPNWYDANPNHGFNSYSDGNLARAAHLSPNPNPNFSSGRGNCSPNPNAKPDFSSRNGNFSPIPNTNPNMSPGRGHFCPNPNANPNFGSGRCNFNPRNSPNFLFGRGRGGFSPNRNPGFSSGGGSGRGGYSPNHSPNFGSVRGCRWNFSSSGGSSRNGGRGRGPISARDRPELFYDKSMMEDPWKDLVPVVGKLLEPESKKSWLPNSVASKKLKTAADVALIVLEPRSSLADCLALSLEDAVRDL